MKKLRKIKLIDVKKVFSKRPAHMDTDENKKDLRFEDDERMLYKVSHIYSNFED